MSLNIKSISLITLASLVFVGCSDDKAQPVVVDSPGAVVKETTSTSEDYQYVKPKDFPESVWNEMTALQRYELSEAEKDKLKEEKEIKYIEDFTLANRPDGFSESKWAAMTNFKRLSELRRVMSNELREEFDRNLEQIRNN